jgi:hypothetical protein
MVLTLHLIVLYGVFPCKALTGRFCIIEVESVYCAVRTKFLYKTDEFRLLKVNDGLRTNLSATCYFPIVRVDVLLLKFVC